MPSENSQKAREHHASRARNLAAHLRSLVTAHTLDCALCFGDRSANGCPPECVVGSTMEDAAMKLEDLNFSTYPENTDDGEE